MTDKKTLSEKVREASRRPVSEKSSYRGGHVARDEDETGDLQSNDENPKHQEDFRSLLSAAGRRRVN
jgi:hypothetical protein